MLGRGLELTGVQKEQRRIAERECRQIYGSDIDKVWQCVEQKIKWIQAGITPTAIVFISIGALALLGIAFFIRKKRYG